jgi:hypothetical protein
MKNNFNDNYKQTHIFIKKSQKNKDNHFPRTSPKPWVKQQPDEHYGKNHCCSGMQFWRYQAVCDIRFVFLFLVQVFKKLYSNF